MSLQCLAQVLIQGSCLFSLRCFLNLLPHSLPLSREKKDLVLHFIQEK